MIKKFNFLFVTMLGLGKVRIIPGTVGSLATIILLYIFFHVLEISTIIISVFLLTIFLYSFFAVSYHMLLYAAK